MSYNPMQPVPSSQGNPSQPFPQPGPQPGAVPPQPFPPQGAAPGLARTSFWRSLGLPGQTALIAGLALLILFFLPWFSTPDFSGFSNVTYPTINYSGWSTARGVALFFSDSSNSLAPFPELWLIMGCAVVLLLSVLFQGIRFLSIRTAGALLVFIGALLVLLELAFLIQVNTIQADLEAGFRELLPRIHVPTVYSVLWAFWLSVVASAAALVVGMYGLLQRRQPAPG